MTAVKLHEKPIEWYLQRMENERPFALAGYSDAEWYSMLRIRESGTTALGQVIAGAHGDRLLDVLKRRATDRRFMFAVPKVLWELPSLIGKVDPVLETYKVTDVYERDMVTDDLAASAGLYPFIKQLLRMDVMVIGNRHLRGLTFLDYKFFVEIPSPNLHMEERGIERAVDEAIQNSLRYTGPMAVLVSAGVSAAVIIDQLYEELPHCWLIDCGSIWDCFVHIGEQREWRSKLYANPVEWERWERKCLTGR
jgi:hypothetical protein